MRTSKLIVQDTESETLLMMYACCEAMQQHEAGMRSNRMLTVAWQGLNAASCNMEQAACLCMVLEEYWEGIDLPTADL